MGAYMSLLRDGQLSEDPELAPIIVKKAKWFEWYNEALYKKSYTYLSSNVSPQLREIIS